MTRYRSPRPGAYAQALRKRWWLIAFTVAMTAGSALFFSHVQYPQYTATAEVIVSPAQPDLDLTQTAQVLLRSYMTVADSNSWAQQVIDELELPMTPETLRTKTQFEAQDDRLAITIEVEDYDDEQASAIAHTWARLLVRWRSEQNAQVRTEDRVHAVLRDPPSSVQSWPPGAEVLVPAGSAFGLVIAGLVIAFLEWLEGGIIGTPQDLEEELGLTVVGAILTRERRG